MSRSEELHNQLAPQIVRAITQSSENEAEALVIFESVFLGVCLWYSSVRGMTYSEVMRLPRAPVPNGRIATEIAEFITQHVVERIAQKTDPRKKG